MENTHDSSNDSKSDITNGLHSKEPDMDRPLSPVLASSGFQRKVIHVRKRDKFKTKIRVKLAHKFTDGPAQEQAKLPNISKIESELQLIDPDSVENRFKKIEQYENEWKRCMNHLYMHEDPKTYINDCKPQIQNVSDFDFKKPISPVSVAKKSKSNSNHKSSSNLQNMQPKPSISEIKPNLVSGVKFEGFCTGTGKNITISNESIKKHSKLFDDILNTTDVGQNSLFKTDAPSHDNLGVSCNLETSITDTQMVLAADNAVVALGDLDTKIKELPNISINFCSADAPLEGEKPLRHRTSLIEEMRELEKLLSEDLPRWTPTDSNSELTERDFVGFTVFEINLAQGLFKILKEYAETTTESSQSCMILNLTRGTKHHLTDTNELASKKIKVDEGLKWNPSKFQGFSTASGKSIAVQEEWLEKVSCMFNNLPELNSISKARTASIKPQVNIENSAMKPLQPVRFSSVGGKNIKIFEQTLNKAETTFCNEEISKFGTDLQPNEQIDTQEYNSNIGLKERVTDLKQNVQFIGFSTANGKSIKISEEALRNSAKCIFNEEDLNFSESDIIDKENTEEHESQSKSLIQPHLTLKQPSFSKSLNSNNNIKSFNSPGPKKRLGISSCKPIVISNNKLQKAKRIFDDFDQNPINTPKKFNPSGTIYSSTPLREVNTPKSVVQTIMRAKADNSLINTNITPIKQELSIREIFTKENVEPNENGSSIVKLKERTEGDVEKWIEKMNEKQRDLEKELTKIIERKLALEEQKKLIESTDHERKRQRVGVLLEKKRISQRISLKEFVNGQKPGDVASSVSHYPFGITPRNAELVHFNCENIPGQKHAPVIRTTDGAVLIPNASNLIGLTEIHAAFQVMPGVDRILLPPGWISNHFKWIVWKLTSFERSFPDKFSGCFSLENVIQQLKYRYDREIDKVERSALRRILEKDDIPQKRIILCVSDIIKVPGGLYELDLTDGWYCIRTIIDQPLSRQVDTSKVSIGTKLIIQCAEILNCQGCHPLEAPHDVRLKINYNCTRRAAWYSKLGYQYPAEPFSIRLRTIHPDGGMIGCIKIYIARVYPVCFMERQGETKAVWRNRKAEEKRAQDWENQRMKQIEIIQHKMQEDFEKELSDNRQAANNQMKKSKISEITSAKLLCEMLETANDPESFRNLLSPSQLESVINYKSNQYMQQQQELSSRIFEEIKNLKCSQRDVVSVLKLRVIDANESSERGFTFSIWRPTEEHLQILREESTFLVYNVLSKRSNELTSSVRTYFKLESDSSLKNSKMKRHLMPISLLQQKFCHPSFNEYDTVGTVVRIQKEAHCQELWLTDFVGRLLFIRVTDGPDKCSMLDNLNKGQTVAAINLMFCKSHEDFAQAIANQCSVVTSYPQYAFLQEALNSCMEQLPKNLIGLLDECDKKIELCLAKVQLTKSSVGSSYISNLIVSTNALTSLDGVFDDSSEDITSIPTRLTTTDVAMSLMNI